MRRFVGSFVVVLALSVASCAIPAGAQPAPDSGAPGGGPVASYQFDAEDALGTDGSGHGHTASVAGANWGPGRTGGGMLLDGQGGMEVTSTESLQAGQGFALECWVRFSDASRNMNIISKDGEYLLRVDPPAEGSNISFFVNVAASLEPRVRGLAAEGDTWYHIVATWDGEYASLWLNGQRFRTRRIGAIQPTDGPALIGKSSEWGPAGLRGILDEVRLYDRALTDAEVLLAEYGLDQPPAGPRVERARFEFDAGAEGWDAQHADDVAVADGALKARVHGHGSVLLNRGLRVPVRDRHFVSLRMAVTGGERGRLLFLTTRGPGTVSFPLKPDGRMHSYVLRLADHAEWIETLTALGVAPSDVDAKVELDFVRAAGEPQAPAEITVSSFLPDEAISRAGRPSRVVAGIRNTGGPGKGLTARLVTKGGLKVLGAARQTVPPIPHGDTRELSWEVQADAPTTERLTLTIAGDGSTPVTSELAMTFTPAVELLTAEYVPEPQIAESDVLVGAHYCPLWKQGSRGSGWELIAPYPERQPALGWYDEDDPEVTDWEIKWALEHGISYFVYCWYRQNQGQGVDMFLEHAIHDGLFHSRYGDRFKFCIMWENQMKGHAGVASEEDFLQNLLPFWIETYFKHPSYLKVDNKPLLFIYRPEFLVDDLGSVENVRRALDKAREACRQAGLDGLTILGEYRGTDPKPLQLMADEGLDYSFAYCWHVGDNPESDEAISAQEEHWREWERLGRIPYLLTVSMGWDSTPWHPSHSIWRLPPEDFRRLCERAKSAMGALPEDSLGSKLILLDNWNEFGEGHYIAPHRQYGFGYLDAVRAAFTDAPEQHTDIVPDDVGLGPYDSRYRAYAELMDRCATRVVGEGLEPGVVAWWTFDEPDDSPCALDYSGNRQGGVLHEADRADGLHGRALSCEGGGVTIPRGAFRHPVDEITVECWIKTETPGQTDKWFVNNVYGDGASGFRLGLSDGKLSWAIPKTSWSHHLVADEPLPLGEWVHVAATYDGQVMQLYMQGRQVGSLERGGRIHAADSRLCLGSYSQAHRAYFSGLLDEVKIHARALTPTEIRSRSRP